MDPLAGRDLGVEVISRGVLEVAQRGVDEGVAGDAFPASGRGLSWQWPGPW